MFDLLAFGATFLVCWAVYFVIQVGAVAAKLVSGVGMSTVLIAVLAAVITGVACWVWGGRWSSSPEVHLLISLAAPFAFVGYCGNYVLIGPVTIDRSITLSILGALASSEARGLTVSKLEAEVPFDRIFAKRLRELDRTRNLQVGSEVRVTRRGLRILALYQWLGRILKVDFQ
jgi:hypothetical protein